jgi:hypothetical protein
VVEVCLQKFNLYRYIEVALDDVWALELTARWGVCITLTPPDP